MNSIGYITKGTTVILLLMSAGITYRCVEDCIKAIQSGEGLGAAIKSTKKRIMALIVTLGVSVFVATISRYYR